MLCRIAWCLQPVVPWRDLRHLSDARPSLPIFPRSGISYATSLGRLIQRLTRLPLELEKTIRDLLPPSLFTSLANSIETLDWLQSNNKTWKSAKHRPKPFSYSLPKLPTASELPSSSSSVLGVSMIWILGEYCLKHVRLGTKETCELEILLPTKSIQGVQFALGTYGCGCTQSTL
jgi:hypothetical protein